MEMKTRVARMEGNLSNSGRVVENLKNVLSKEFKQNILIKWLMKQLNWLGKKMGFEVRWKKPIGIPSEALNQMDLERCLEYLDREGIKITYKQYDDLVAEYESHQIEKAQGGGMGAILNDVANSWKTHRE